MSVLEAVFYTLVFAIGFFFAKPPKGFKGGWESIGNNERTVRLFGHILISLGVGVLATGILATIQG